MNMGMLPLDFEAACEHVSTNTINRLLEYGHDGHAQMVAVFNVCEQLWSTCEGVVGERRDL